MSLTKLKDAAIQEIQKLEKKIGSLKKEIDKLFREKNNALSDVNEANIRKANALLESDIVYNKATKLKTEIKQLNTDKVLVVNSIDKLTEDAEKREIKITADEDEVAEIKAETLEKNQIAKIKAQGAVALNTQLDAQIEEVKKIKDENLIKEKLIDEKIAEKDNILSYAVESLDNAKEQNKKSDELKMDAEIVLKQTQEEKEKYVSLNKGLERKHEEKNGLIKKAQDTIKGLQDRELKLKNNESFNDTTSKSLISERNRVALKEAKVTKILDSLLSDKNLEDKLKELGLNK